MTVRDASTAEGGKARYALQNCRVVDFGWAVAGPVLGALLADLGAEVIRVESRKHIDTSRLTADNVERHPEKDPLFHTLNRNKLGITVDMKEPEGQALLRRLINVSDVVLENFYPGVMARCGLDYQTLAGENPGLIMISLPGLGSWGPEAGTPAYAKSLSALGGLDSMVGYPGERVLGVQEGLSDINSGMLGAFAVLAALIHRRKTGEGQHIELAQVEGLLGCLGEGIMEYQINGLVPNSVGNNVPDMAPHNNYRCKGEDQWVSIAVKTDGEWQSLCRAIDRLDLANDDRFATLEKRLVQRGALDQLLTAWTAEREPDEITRLLQAAGVAAMTCMDGQTRFVDPHFQEREVFAFFPHPATGSTLIPRSPFRFSESNGPYYRHAPLLGEHNAYVFGELLGLTTEEIASLEERKVLY